MICSSNRNVCHIARTMYRRTSMPSVGVHRLSQMLLLLLLIATTLTFAACDNPKPTTQQPPHRPQRILGIFIHPGGSHYHTFYPIMNGLAKRGHNVTVLSYFNAPASVSHNYHERRFDGLPVINASMPLMELRRPSRNLYTMYAEFFELKLLGEASCRDTLYSPQIDEILDEHARQPFDLVVTELFNTDCILGVIVGLMRVPYVGLSSCTLMPWLNDRAEMPDLPAFVPSEFVGFSERMTYAERVTSWLITKSVKMLYRLIEMSDNHVLAERFGAGRIPDVGEIASEVSLVLVNTHYSLHGPRPMSPKEVEIGGVHIEAANELPESLQTLLDNAEHGVIILSWGSNLRGASLDPQYVQNIMRAFAQLPQQIIWKWENDILEGKPANVHIQKWLPQRDILCHPNVKLFWTHGGNLGLSEATHCGTPVVITSVFGDQFANAAAAINRGMGVLLPFDNLDSTDFILETIREGLRPEYKQNAVQTSYAFRNRPMPPLATAIWWIENVMYSPDNFRLARSYSAQMSWFTYHSVDAMLTIFGGVTLLVAVLGWLVCWIVRRLTASNGRRKEVANSDRNSTGGKLKQK